MLPNNQLSRSARGNFLTELPYIAKQTSEEMHSDNSTVSRINMQAMQAQSQQPRAPSKNMEVL